MEKVGIISCAQTKYSEKRDDVRENELVYEAVSKVLEESGLEFRDDGKGIDAAVTCSHDHFDGVTISNWPIAEVTGGHLRPEEKVAGDGAMAVFYAAMQILSKKYEVVLVAVHTKESQTDRRIIENTTFDPIYHQMLGIDYLSASALSAKYYMEKRKISLLDLSKIVVRNREKGVKNPYAQIRERISIDDVMSSPFVSYPLRELDIKPTSDGACALILANEKKAKMLSSKPVWIAGFGNCYDGLYLGDRDLSDCLSLKRAAKMAYKMAGIENPKKEIDLFEISTEYSYEEPLFCEGLYLCEDGKEIIDSNLFNINPSGGLLCGVPVHVSGASRVCEVFFQLAKKAGEAQIDGAKVGLAHGTLGPCGQMHSVIILSLGG